MYKCFLLFSPLLKKRKKLIEKNYLLLISSTIGLLFWVQETQIAPWCELFCIQNYSFPSTRISRAIIRISLTVGVILLRGLKQFIFAVSTYLHGIIKINCFVPCQLNKTCSRLLKI